MAADAKKVWASLKTNLSEGCCRVREGVVSSLTATHTIPNGASALEDLLSYLRVKYVGTGYECQIFGFEEEGRYGKLLQIRSVAESYLGAVKTVTGLRSVICVTCLPAGNDLSIRIFGGKWLEKVALNVVSWFVLHPLFVTSAIGGWRQKTLVDKLDRDVLAYFALATGKAEDSQKSDGGAAGMTFPLLEAPKNCRW
jgi:hypothetical protein